MKDFKGFIVLFLIRSFYIMRLFSYKHIILAAVLFISHFFSFAQTVDENGVDLDYRKKQAEKKFSRAEYDGAIADYTDLLRYFPKDAFLHFQLAEASYKMRDYVTAQESYHSALINDSLNFQYAQLMMARMMKYNALYENALKEFDRFILNDKNSDHPAWIEQAELEKQGCLLALQEQRLTKDISIIHLDSTINYYYTESSPLQIDSATLIYSTLRTDSMDAEHYFNLVPALSHFFRSVKTKSGWSMGERIYAPINNYDFHSGNATLTPDGKRFYFTECPFRITGDLNCYISMSAYQNNEWSSPGKLNKEINQKNYVATQPNAATDENGNDVLYFVSDREGGLGGMDIWRVILHNGEMISPPENLGEPINTKGDETTPFFDSKKNRLYFSSDFHISLGGFDIYYAEEKKGGWSNPVNVGFPINSSVDDMYYSSGFDTSEAFIISNRIGTLGLKGPTCCDDIFIVKNEQPKTVWLEGLIVLNERDNHDTLRNVVLEISQFTGEKSIMIIDTLLRDPQKFRMELALNSSYQLKVTKNGWYTIPPSIVKLNPDQLQKQDIKTVNLFLFKPHITTFVNVYYYFDSDSILLESFISLDTLSSILKSNPEIKIELASHTDSRGSEEYNLDLSQKRAEACKEYLVQNGIDALRIVPVGYGETKLLQNCIVEKIGDCSDDPSTDCPCHQKNRRTEFKIIAW